MLEPDKKKPIAAGEAQAISTTGVPVTADRILDAYFGKMGDQFMLDTQKRIHWVCGKAQGHRILDVGCSQGIVPILLGREGCQVTGIDSDPQAIAAADAFLAGQPPGVQNNVTFINDDFTTHIFEDEAFDTVILSEVLEHLVNPASFVALAAQRLEAGGRLVITVPFGVNDFVDHKRTYYALEPLRLVWALFSIDEVELFGKWIGFSCSKRQSAIQDDLTDWPWPLIERMEKAFHAIERTLLTQSRSLSAKLDDANKKYIASNEQVTKLKSQLSDLTQLEQSLVDKESQIKASEEALGKMRGELATVRADLDEANLNYRAVTEQAVLLKERISQADTALAKAGQDVQTEQAQRHAGEIVMAKLQEQLKHQQALFEQQRTELEQTTAGKESKDRALTEQAALLNERISQAAAELARAGQDVQTEQAQRHAGEIELAKLQEQLKHQQALFEQQRTELEQTTAGKESKDRALTEQAALLNERISQAAAELARAGQDVQTEQAQRHAGEIELAKLQEQLKHQQALFEQQRAELEQTTADKESKVQTLETELERLRSEATEQRADLDETNLKYQDAAEQAALLRAQLAQDEAELDDTRKEIGSEQTQRIAGEIELFRLQEQFRHQQSLAETVLVAKERRITTLQEALERSRGEVEASKPQAKEEHAILAGELVALQCQFEDARAELTASQQQLAATTQETETLRQSLTVVQAGQQATQAALVKISSELEIAQALRRDEQHRLKKITDRAALMVKTANAPPAQAMEVRHSQKKSKKEKQKGHHTAAALTVSTATVPPPVQSISPFFVDTLKGLKVASIMDEFTYSSYRPECNLLRLTPPHWQHELDAFAPELLFIESAWKGKDELWATKISNKSEELIGILEWCRTHQVPTIFWNKEDPVHFEIFLKIAKLFDFVFTTDIDCINRYKGALGHDRVYLLPFACQPQTTNPIETYERKDAFCFAGSYYDKYPERTRDLGNFVATLSDYRPIEIYDRNYGKNIKSFLFPPEYQPFIVGNLPYDQIDKAYKGYRYAINLNSIKQSQSMFARRVFDLLASNTITISNFSRGVRQFFGDLVITADNGEEIVRRLQTLAGHDLNERKLRLAGLRKVMQEHTYQDRMAYVVSKVQGCTPPSLLPRIAVTAYAKNQQQLCDLLESFSRQNYAQKRLLIVVPNSLTPGNVPSDETIQILSAGVIDVARLCELIDASEFIAGMVPDDYYGPNYLLDLALATRYSSAAVIGKVTHHVWSDNSGLSVARAGKQYQMATGAPARAALVKAGIVEEQLLREWVTSIHTRQIEAAEVLGIDEFNYCKDGNTPNFLSTQAGTVSDLVGLDAGISTSELLNQAERIAPAPEEEEVIRDECLAFSSEEIGQLFPPPPSEITYQQIGNTLRVTSTLAAGGHAYAYANNYFSLEELGLKEQIKFHLSCSTDLNIQIAIIFFNAQKKRISHVLRAASANQIAIIPEGAVWFRLGLRFFESGTASINEFLFGHLHRRPAVFVQNTPQLILTKRYPNYDDLYNYSFVHTRAMAYKASGVQAEVFRLLPQTTASYGEFQNIDVITGDHATLNCLLSGRHVKSVLVHFLDEEIWYVLRQHIEHIKVFVWIHGAEIQPWHRRDYNYETDQELDAAKLLSEVRMAFWRTLLKDMPANLRLIFVSNYFAEEVMEDLGFRIPSDHYTIIHNPIDTEFFAYQEKSPEQRKKILSIRPYASRKYANDLSVQAILSLSNKPWFNDLEFRMIGDGKLFDETLEPLREFSNVYIERRFLTHAEIAALHREYGLFLCPTRMDAQGVSKDEAMSSGMVPITNNVTAIPEFVDEHCGILAGAEDSVGLAHGIERLYEEPELFLNLSRHAAARVRRQCSFEHTIRREINLIAGRADTE